MKGFHFFSVNGLQSSELNIDFIGSLVTASMTPRCLLTNCVRVSLRKRTESQGEKDKGDERWGRESEKRGHKEKGKRLQEDDTEIREQRQRTEGAEEGDKKNTGGMRRKKRGFREQQLSEE